MSITPIIYVVIILILLSLASSLFFLFKDQGEGKRSVYSLGVRVSLAIILLMLVAYGLYTGELGNSVAWRS
jgi:cytochrome bd-type quinol oxidase subunit 2|tara:strand:- start:290 stop:502 length:213 start_codon:yes stop_codon:yes gene_type:complete